MYACNLYDKLFKMPLTDFLFNSFTVLKLHVTVVCSLYMLTTKLSKGNIRLQLNVLFKKHSLYTIVVLLILLQIIFVIWFWIRLYRVTMGCTFPHRTVMFRRYHQWLPIALVIYLPVCCFITYVCSGGWSNAFLIHCILSTIYKLCLFSSRPSQSRTNFVHASTSLPIWVLFCFYSTGYRYCLLIYLFVVLIILCFPSSCV